MEGADDPKSSSSADLSAKPTAREPVEAERVREPARELVGVSGPGGGGGRRGGGEAPLPAPRLGEPERRLLGDLFAIVAEHAADAAVPIDRARVQEAFVFACEQHAAQRRKSGED